PPRLLDLTHKSASGEFANIRLASPSYSKARPHCAVAADLMEFPSKNSGMALQQRVPEHCKPLHQTFAMPLLPQVCRSRLQAHAQNRILSQGVYIQPVLQLDRSAFVVLTISAEIGKRPRMAMRQGNERLRSLPLLRRIYPPGRGFLLSGTGTRVGHPWHLNVPTPPQLKDRIQQGVQPLVFLCSRNQARE